MVVTGSSSGIGRACALHLDELGFHVFAGVRREEDGKRLRVEASGALEPLILDVTDEAATHAAAARVAEAADGGLVGLVNNAGVQGAGPLENIPLEEFRRVLEINVTGQVAVTQAFLPQLRQRRGSASWDARPANAAFRRGGSPRSSPTRSPPPVLGRVTWSASTPSCRRAFRA